MTTVSTVADTPEFQAAVAKMQGVEKSAIDQGQLVTKLVGDAAYSPNGQHSPCVLELIGATGPDVDLAKASADAKTRLPTERQRLQDLQTAADILRRQIFNGYDGGPSLVQQLSRDVCTKATGDYRGRVEALQTAVLQVRDRMADVEAFVGTLEAGHTIIIDPIAKIDCPLGSTTHDDSPGNLWLKGLARYLRDH